MKEITAILSSMLIVGSVSAASDADVYHGWAKGNPDLATEAPTENTVSGVQPGVGEAFGHYGIWGAGNPELTLDIQGVARSSSGFPDIYGGFPDEL